MRKLPWIEAEKFRWLDAPAHYASSYGEDCGVFDVGFEGVSLRVIVSASEGWEHVSVSRPSRCPTWKEMCFVKDLFWEPHECAIQYHPAKKDYVNCNPFCLHIWKPIGVTFPTPPSFMVGPDDFKKERLA